MTLIRPSELNVSPDVNKPFLIYGETPMVTDNALEDVQEERREEGERLEEIWKPIEGYEGRYEISSLGRVRSFAQDRANGKVKAGHPVRKGYRHILLYDGEGKKRWYPIHRLVAAAFLQNPHGLEQVNHRDEDKKNNRVENLEWCDNSYNHNYGTRNKRVSEANKCCETTSLKVCSIDENGHIECYDSIGEAERQTGCSHSNIVRTLKGRTNHCGNRQWFYC